MAELRLLFDVEKVNDAPSISVSIAPEGVDGAAVEKQPLAFDIPEADRRELRWYLEKFMDLPDHGSIVRAEKIEAKLQTWGRRLFDAAFAADGQVETVRQFLDENATPIITVASDDPDVLALPWEMLTDDRGMLFRRAVIRRQLPDSRGSLREPTHREPTQERGAIRDYGLPLRMLVVVSRPSDAGFIDPRMTTKGLLDALRPLGKENVVVDFCRPPTLLQLERMLNDARERGEPYTIVHFDGHGTYDELRQLGVLCFEGSGPHGNSTGKVDNVSANHIGELLSGYDIPLMILEACRSSQVEGVALRAVAPRLIDAGVGSVIAMSHAVHVEAARVLLECFYRRVARGDSIGQSVSAARAELILQPDRWIELGPGGRTVKLQDWFLPQLYQRGNDAALVTRSVSEDKNSASGVLADGSGYDVFLSHNHASRERVIQIAERLRDRHGLRVWLDAWNMPHEPIHLALETGVTQSRMAIVFCTRESLASQWVEVERQLAYAKDSLGRSIIPVLLEDVAEDLPLGLKMLPRYDLRDPAADETEIARLAAVIGTSSSPAPLAAKRRSPPEPGELGAFPQPPRHRFHGRARELLDLEREFVEHSAVLLYAMGGMGKTTLAREAAYWWTETGLFPEGACFVSFENPAAATPQHIALTLGTYLEGESFASLPAAEQMTRARDLFRERRVLMVWDNFESILPAFVAGASSRSSDRVAEVERSEPPADIAPDEEHQAGGSLRSTPATPVASIQGLLNPILELFEILMADPHTQGRLLITCRPGETGLPDVQRFGLSGLERPDSLWLLYQVLKTAGLEPGDKRLPREALGRLCKRLEDHPLSIELVGPHLRTLTPDEIINRFAELVGQFQTDDAEVQRNSSLLASLRFSTDRLSPAAREALGWLGLFEVGVFEYVLLEVSRIQPEEWEAIRAELEATALIRVEHEIEIADRPYLKFHPTLAAGVSLVACASSPSYLEQDAPATRERYITVYDELDTLLRKALRGSQPKAAMEVLSREEPNFRRAVGWSVADGDFPVAAAMGDTFKTYLEFSNRLRERDAWVGWLAEAAADVEWSAAAADAERNAAWSLLTQGQAAEGLRRLQALVARLEQTSEFDPAFQLAWAKQWLGRIHYATGQAATAIPILRDAVTRWETLVAEKAQRQQEQPQISNLPTGGSRGTSGEGLQDGSAAQGTTEEPGDTIDPSPELRLRPSQGKREVEAGERWAHILGEPMLRDACRAEFGNLSATLGDLANALMDARQTDEALQTAEQCVAIQTALDNNREIAADHGRVGQILRQQGRYADAEGRYDQALAAAQAAGDTELEAMLLQHQGSLALERSRYDQAIQRFKRALTLFQRAGNEASVMRTCNLLGVVELEQGRLAEARAWYERSREIAAERQDQRSLGAAAQNLGIVCQLEGESAREQCDESAVARHFAAAERFLLESLQIELDQNNEPGEAGQSYCQLGKLYLLMNRLDEAKQHAERAREIGERLGDLRLLSSVYLFLKNIAAARGDAEASAKWAEREREVDNELARRAGGGDPQASLGPLLASLTVACVQAALGGRLPAEADQLLDQLNDPDAGPLQSLAVWLRQIADSNEADLPALLAAPPSDLPDAVAEVLDQIREQL